MYKIFLLFFQFSIVFSYELPTESVFIDTLKRREQIPLHHINRRNFYDNLNYRRMKEIRINNILPNKMFELSEIINNRFNNQNNREVENVENDNLRTHHDQHQDQLKWYNVNNYDLN